VHNRLTRLCPSLRRDLIDHRYILILSLFSEGTTINIMNVYSDDQHTAINLLAERAPILPACVLMTGDFNCHSREWDPSVPHHRTTAILLLDTAARLGLELTLPVNPRPTFLSHNVELRGSVIDLVFIKASESLVQPRRLLEWQGPSDHIPLASKFSLPSELEDFKRVSIAKGSDAETQFVEQLIGGIRGIRLETPTSIAEVDVMAQAVADVFSKAWSDNATEKRITRRSEPWWNDTCSETLLQYRDDKTPENWSTFRKATRAAKRKFFDAKIEEIAKTNRRPWDLMEWVKGRKLPPCEAIQYNGQPCHTMPELWDALHNTYNSAADRPCDLSVLDELPDLPVREWASFSALELMEVLAACSSLSSPGPDHVTWVHLKKIIAEPQCLNVFIKLANACLTVGRWPKHFKESVSVIIPKPGKPSYSAPKAFRPIALLNTLEKLIEKMLSNRIQHDMIAYDIVDPNQFGGICQRSTEDAGLYLTHLVRTGWAQGLKTSVIAFDIAQFFPSINHDALMAIL